MSCGKGKACCKNQDCAPATGTSNNPYIPKQYKVIEFYRETPDTFSLTIDMGVKHDPGQFVQVSLPGVGEAPISIASSSDAFLKLSIREVGNMTNALAKLREGDPIWVRGPYGNGYPMNALRGDNLLIIGGGCGVAPLKGIIDYVEQHREEYGEINLLLGYRDPNNMLYNRELAEWEKKYRLHISVDKNPEGQFCYDGTTGFVTDVLKDLAISNEKTVAFICGPPRMMSAVIDILNEKGFKDEQIFISAERLMYCAIGVCCHCMIKGKFCCLDGPVFRYDVIRGDMDE